MAITQFAWPTRSPWSTRYRLVDVVLCRWCAWSTRLTQSSVFKEVENTHKLMYIVHSLHQQILFSINNVLFSL